MGGSLGLFSFSGEFCFAAVFLFHALRQLHRPSQLHGLEVVRNSKGAVRLVDDSVDGFDIRPDLLDTISNALLGLFHGGRSVHHLGVEHVLKGDGFGQIADDTVEVCDELLLLVGFLVLVVGLDGLVDGLHCLDDEIRHFSDLGLETVIRSHDSFLDTDAAV